MVGSLVARTAALRSDQAESCRGEAAVMATAIAVMMMTAKKKKKQI